VAFGGPAGALGDFVGLRTSAVLGTMGTLDGFEGLGPSAVLETADVLKPSGVLSGLEGPGLSVALTFSADFVAASLGWWSAMIQ
jgi:hypothetical protein